MTVVYVAIGSDLATTFETGGTAVDVPVGDAAIVEGERLALTRGCPDCHGADLTGRMFFDLPDGTRLPSPDLVQIANDYTTAELERVIRHGVRPNGTSVLLPMPSEMFYHLSDKDLASIIAFMRSKSPGDERRRDSYFGPVGRAMLLVFKQETGTILSAAAIDHEAPRIDSTRDDPATLGKYLAMTSCSECHNADLRGTPDGLIPPLTIVAAYQLQQFAELMRSGVPIGDRQLDLMARVAKGRFVHFTDDEISALYTYLKSASFMRDGVSEL